MSSAFPLEDKGTGIHPPTGSLDATPADPPTEKVQAAANSIFQDCGLRQAILDAAEEPLSCATVKDRLHQTVLKANEAGIQCSTDPGLIDRILDEITPFSLDGASLPKLLTSSIAAHYLQSPSLKAVCIEKWTSLFDKVTKPFQSMAVNQSILATSKTSPLHTASLYCLYVCRILQDAATYLPLKSLLETRDLLLVRRSVQITPSGQPICPSFQNVLEQLKILREHEIEISHLPLPDLITPGSLQDQDIASLIAFAPPLTFLDLAFSNRLTNASITSLTSSRMPLEILELARCEGLTDEAVIALANSKLPLTALGLAGLYWLTSKSVQAIAESQVLITRLCVSSSLNIDVLRTAKPDMKISQVPDSY